MGLKVFEVLDMAEKGPPHFPQSLLPSQVLSEPRPVQSTGATAKLICLTATPKPYRLPVLLMEKSQVTAANAMKTSENTLPNCQHLAQKKTIYA